MSEKIDKTLKKIAAGTSKGNTPTSSSIDEPRSASGDLPGDPNCPYCAGIGYLRRDLPLGHPEFGKLQVCTCRNREVSQQVRDRLYALSRLDELKHMTFENFNPRGRVGLSPMQAASLEWALNNAQIYARTLRGWVVFQGDFGCGKTHLAAAIANFTVSMGVPTLFITVPDLLDSLRFAYQDPEETFETRFEEVRTAPLLILDDFGTQSATPWAQEKLFQIINYRYINRLPTVVTTNLSLSEIEERIRSRLEDSELVTIHRILAEDYRTPATDIGHHKLSSLELLHDRTFENFDLRKSEGLHAEELHSLENALKTAREFAEQPRGWLVISGPYGCGKTHLAAAIANYRSQVDFPPLFVSVPDLLDHLRSTFNPNSPVSLDRRFEEVRTTPLLILDDLETQSVSPWVREKLFQLFNYRYFAEKPTIITTVETVETIEPRLRVRMLDKRLSRILAIHAPGYTGGARPDRGVTQKRRRSTYK